MSAARRAGVYARQSVESVGVCTAVAAGLQSAAAFIHGVTSGRADAGRASVFWGL